jgi:hypothetical protein
MIEPGTFCNYNKESPDPRNMMAHSAMTSCEISYLKEARLLDRYPKVGYAFCAGVEAKWKRNNAWSASGLDRDVLPGHAFLIFAWNFVWSRPG